MARVLRLTGTPDAVLAPTGEQLARINDPKRTELTLRTANRLFLDHSQKLEVPYQARMTALGAPVEPPRFGGASGTACLGAVPPCSTWPRTRSTAHAPASPASWHRPATRSALHHQPNGSNALLAIGFPA
jgi:hypothetical protein